MAEIATIARPYADALYKASSGDLPSTSAWLDPVATIASNPQLQQFAASPGATTDQVMGLISSLMDKGLSPRASNFLTVLLDNGRFDALPEIARQFRVQANGQQGTADAVVHSAFPIGDEQLAELAGTLEQRFKTKLNLSVQVDESLIGGIRVVVGDEVLDTSVRARLDQMKVALAA